MTEAIVAATPVTGHTLPMLRIARGLRERGHAVTVLGGSRFAGEVPGADFVALPGAADYDDRRLAELHPRRAELPPGPPQLVYDIQHVFADAVADQHAGLQELLARRPDAAVLTDSHFFGAWPALLGAPGRRPRRSVAVGITVVGLASRDTGPFGPVEPEPGQDPAEANLAPAAGFAAALSDGQTYMESTLRACGATAPVPSLFDGLVTVPDAYAQLCAPGFEFARGDAPATLRFVGALPPPPTPAGWTPPPWWGRLDAERPVVVVTQGTLANDDFARLVEPTLTALAGRDVTVVAALGREPGAYRGPVPDNAVVEAWVPFDELLPRADVLVTNGGYGGVQQALAHGVPVVVAGTTEDKALVAARVARLGLGRELATDTPSAEQVGAAVTGVLDDRDTAARVAALRDAYAGLDPVEGVAALLR